jgi:hypothetical protein
MKAFFKTLLLFTIPVLVILLLCELFLREMPTTYKIKNAQFTAARKDVEVLILGNSHATYGLDPRVFSHNAINMAALNQSLYFDKRITLSHIDELKELKYVLISIDFHSLYFSDEGIRNTWSYYGYGIDYKNSLPALTKWSYLCGFKGPLLLEFLKRSFEKKYKTVKALDADVDVDYNQPYSEGFVAKLGGPQIGKELNEDRAKFFNDIVRSSKERDSVFDDLEDFIAQLKNRNITPILITLPCYSAYRELLDKNIQEQNKTDIQAIRDKYQVAYWDYFAMPLNPDCFYNCDHLNEKGAIIVSRDVDTRLKALMGEK